MLHVHPRLNAALIRTHGQSLGTLNKQCFIGNWEALDRSSAYCLENSSRDLDNLVRLSGSDVVLNHPEESSWNQRM